MKQDAVLRLIPSGHCPHDDTPELANKELISWLTGLSSQGIHTSTTSEGCGKGDEGRFYVLV